MFKNLKNKDASYVTVIVLIFSYFLYVTLKYLHPLAEDGVIYIWPAGKAIADAPSLFIKIKILTASFMGEDHLSPVHHLYGYLLYLIADKPEPAIMIATKIIFLGSVVSTLCLYHLLYDNKYKTMFFALLLSLCTTMTWQNMVYPVSFTIPIIPSMWTFYFLHKYLTTEKTKYLVFCGVLYFVASLSFEIAFVILPLCAAYTIWFSLRIKDQPLINSCLKIALVGGVLVLAFIPYLFIHHQLYGGILPASRLDLKPALSYQITMLTHTLSQWNFGIPRLILKIIGETPIKFIKILIPFSFLGVGIFLIRNAWKNRKQINFLSPISISLLSGFFLQVSSVAYSGRFDPGMWTLVGLFYLFLLSDLLFNWASYFMSYGRLFILTIVILLPINLIQPISALADNYYFFRQQEGLAGYRAINQGVDNLTIIKLPSAREQIHPTAFWIGNKIFNGMAGLDYLEEYNMLMFQNMIVRADPNTNNVKFIDYVNEIDSLSKSTETAVVVNDINLYTRFYDPSKGTHLESTSVVIPHAAKESFSLKLLPSIGVKRDIVLSFTKCLTAEEMGGMSVIFNDLAVTDVNFSSCSELKFESKNSIPGNENILKLIKNQDSLDKIKIFNRFAALEKPKFNFIKIPIVSKEYDCRYMIGIKGNVNIGWRGTIHPGTPQTLYVPSGLNGQLLEINSVKYGTSRDSTVPEYASIPVTENVSPVQLCNN